MMLLLDAGEVFTFENKDHNHMDVEYASVTSHQDATVVFYVDNEVVDTVLIGKGSSHSWWTNAGGKLLRYGLKKNQIFRVETDARIALRIDWTP